MSGRPLTTMLVAVALLLPPAAGNGKVEAPAGSVLETTQHLVPVEGTIIDPFRPPDQPWLPGNRGLEFETESGSIAVASADGVVVFAGSVAGRYHVTIRHSSRLRTTLAFVAEILVAEGQWVGAGDPVAVVADSVHFTARVDGFYVDPEILLAPHRWTVRLVPLR